MAAMADASRSGTAIDAPVRVLPAGNMFLLGLSNGFDTTYPVRLTGKVRCVRRYTYLRDRFLTWATRCTCLLRMQLAPEEFAATVGKVNAVLERDVPRGVAWFLAGYIVCVCTLGLSLAPALYRRDQVGTRVP